MLDWLKKKFDKDSQEKEEEKDLVGDQEAQEEAPEEGLQEDQPSQEEPDQEAEVIEDKEEDLDEAPEEAPQEAQEEAQEEAPQPLNFFQKLKQGLGKTSKDLGSKINQVIGNYVKIDDDLLDDLEDILITADVGVESTMVLVDRLRDRLKEEAIQDPLMVKPLLAEEITKLMTQDDLSPDLNIDPAPAIVLVIGVNGVGKTTTIGKMAQLFRQSGKSVIIAAADTFRAAAIEQVQVWGQRAGVPVIAHQEGADPASVIFDAIAAAKSRKTDILICDTAGRLHNKSNLMQELEKINRVIEKEYPQASKEVLLVLDATTGQNALIQAKTFNEAANITGIALTKLDGTAKGGVLIPLQTQLGIPIKLVGVGEGVDDLQPFIKEDFAKALLDLD